MEFKFTTCHICCRHLSRLDEIALSYRLSLDSLGRLVPDSVSLDGRQPWSGVRCICINCIRFLVSTMRETYPVPDGVRISCAWGPGPDVMIEIDGPPDEHPGSHVAKWRADLRGSTAAALGLAVATAGFSAITLDEDLEKYQQEYDQTIPPS